MPLQKDCSKKAHAANVRELVRSGRPADQANAIAYAVAKKHGCAMPKQKAKRG
jgi:hypothetical protein